MTTREYNETDAAAIMKLCEKFQDFVVALDPKNLLRQTPEYKAWSLERKTKKMQHVPCCFYVATDQEKIIGFIFGCVEPEPPKEASYSGIIVKAGTIEELFVDTEYRGQGIGSALLKKTEEFFRNQGCAQSGLNVLSFNTAAQKLYEEAGYAPRSTYFTKDLPREENGDADTLASEVVDRSV